MNGFASNYVLILVLVYFSSRFSGRLPSGVLDLSLVIYPAISDASHKYVRDIIHTI